MYIYTYINIYKYQNKKHIDIKYKSQTLKL